MSRPGQRAALPLESCGLSQQSNFFPAGATFDPKNFRKFSCRPVMYCRRMHMPWHPNKFRREIPHHFADVILDRFIIMPNHLHGILSICKNDRANVSPAEMPSAVSTFGPLKPGSLSVVISSYKSAATKWCHQNGHSEFGWQPPFYDHGVEDEDSLNEIREYIGNNPKRWEMKRKL